MGRDAAGRGTDGAARHRGDTWTEADFRGDQVIVSLVLPGFATTVAELWMDVDDDEAADAGE